MTKKEKIKLYVALLESKGSCATYSRGLSEESNEVLSKLTCNRCEKILGGCRASDSMYKRIKERLAKIDPTYIVEVLA